ncbi:MAG: MFS transporter [Oscillospiraceae bacterium]|nr:MFS transporter [Oscillospiraceae bacterium]
MSSEKQSPVEKLKIAIDGIKSREHEEGRLSFKEHYSFGLTRFGYGMINKMADYLQQFYIAIGIEIKTASQMRSLLRIWEMVNDTFSATVIDRPGKAQESGTSIVKTGREGKFTRFLAPLAPFLAISAVLMFIRLPFDNINNVIIASAVAYALWYMFRAFSDISINSMQAVMSPLLDERSTYLTVGNLGNTLSGAIPGLIPVAYDILTKSKTNEVTGEITRSAILSEASFFTYCAVVFCAIGLLAVLFSKNLKERVFAAANDNKPLQNFITFFKNKTMLLLWSSNLANIIATIGWEAGPLFFTRGIKNYTLQSILWSATGIPSFAVSLLSPWFLKRFTPRKVVVFNKLLCAACMFGMYFAVSRAGYSTALGYGLIIAFNVISSIPTGVSGIAEQICFVNTFDYTELKTGERAEATTYAVTGILNKGVAAIGIALAGYLLGRAGFVSGEGIELAQNTKDALFMFWSVMQGIGHLLFAIPYFFYKLEGDKLDEIQDELARRRGEKLVTVERADVGA